MSYIGNSPGVASQRVTTTLTATAAQTQFTTQSGYVLGYVDVYLNGAKLVNGSDFEAITGTNITLFAGAASGDVVELVSYVPRGLSDGYTKAEADSKFLDVGGDTATGNLAFATATLSGNLTLNGGTANGVGYLNGSKVVVAGSALTFDGTVLAAPTLNLTNALGVANGGTGATTANAALNALLPAQTGNATKYLQTDGTNTTWDAVSLSTADITGVLPLANGGTGATTAAGALTSLGAYAASNPSGYTTNSGTVTSVGGTGTVNGLTLTGTVSTTGNLTLGGTLDLSAYSAAGAFSTLSASGAVTLSGGTANGVAYLNASKVVTSGSALTFNGTSLGVGSASYGNAGNINVSVGAPGTTIGGLQLWSTTTGNHYVQFGDGTTGTETYRGAVGYNHTADNLVFYSAGAIGMTLTSSSLYTASNIKLGFGTSNPDARVDAEVSSGAGYRAYKSTTGGFNAFNFYTANENVIGTIGVSPTNDNFYLGYGTTPVLTWNNTGNVLIGTATNTNSSKLVVAGTISQTVGGTQYQVVDQSDIGTAPNEIPLNQYLGNMAYQDSANYYNTGMTVGFRNRIINGAMMIDQRNAGASYSVSGAVDPYVLDRWKVWANGGSGSGASFTVQQSSTAPEGFSKSILITQTGSATPTGIHYNLFGQYIEGQNISDLGWGTPSAKSVTLSFWIRSSLTGTFGGAISNEAQIRSYPFTYTINAANTWEQKIIVVPGDTTGTWLTTSAVGIKCFFDLGTGPSYTGPANTWAASTYLGTAGTNYWVGNNGSTLYITGVQLEKGNIATSFDVRPIGTELALCQRYFVAYGAPISNQYVHLGIGAMYTGTATNITIALPVPMRATPTISKIVSSSLGNVWLHVYVGSSGFYSNSTPQLGETLSVGSNALRLYCPDSYSGGTAGQAAWCAVPNGAQLQLSAELT